MSWKKFSGHIGNNGKLQIIAWLEIDTPTATMLDRAKVTMSVKRKELRKKLLWLTSDIDVLNTRSYQDEWKGIRVAVI